MDYPAEDIVNINGFAKGYGFSPGNKITGTNHEWNAVKIKDEWCLIDSTWGAGSLSGSSFVFSYKEYYLCTPPEQYIRSHLPQESQSYYQLLDPKVETETFEQFSYPKIDFYKFGFNKITPDYAIHEICGVGQITLNYKSEIEPSLLWNIQKDGNNVPDSVTFKKIIDGYNIILSINEEGSYDLDIFAERGNSGYSFMVSFIIKCNVAPVEKYYIPGFYDGYRYDIKMELISPLNNNLIQGNKYNFEIKAPGYESIYLELDSEIIQMYKSSQNFKADNVLIHGDRVYVSGKKESESDHTLISYSTKGTTVEFPTCYSSNLNVRLESPLKSSLVRGSSVRFEILCNTEQIFRIYFKNYATSIPRDISTQNFIKSGTDNTYYFETVVSSTTTYSKLFIGYESNNEYKDLYSFDLSNSS